MQCSITIGHRLRVGSLCAVGKVLALAVLLAVPTLGLARLSADLFTSWQGRSAQEALPVSNSSDGLLAFDAPASTLRQHQLQINASVSATGPRDGAASSLLATDWRDTAQPMGSTSTVNSILSDLARDQFISDLLLLNAGVSSSIVNALMLEQIATNRIVSQNLLAISQSPTLNVSQINGFVGSLVLSEFRFDAALVAAGAPPNAMAFILGYQLGFNEVITQLFLLAAPTPLTPATPTT